MDAKSLQDNDLVVLVPCPGGIHPISGVLPMRNSELLGSNEQLHASEETMKPGNKQSAWSCGTLRRAIEKVGSPFRKGRTVTEVQTSPTVPRITQTRATASINSSSPSPERPVSPNGLSPKWQPRYSQRLESQQDLDVYEETSSDSKAERRSQSQSNSNSGRYTSSSATKTIITHQVSLALPRTVLS